jgi:hypothetical protein
MNARRNAVGIMAEFVSRPSCHKRRDISSFHAGTKLAAKSGPTTTRSIMSDEQPKKTTRGTRGARKRATSEAANASPIDDLRPAERVVPVPQTSEIDGPSSEPIDAATPENIEEEIRRRAYELYLSRGGANGDDLSDWLEAERLVRSQRGSEVGHAENILASDQIARERLSSEQISSEQHRE